MGFTTVPPLSASFQNDGSRFVSAEKLALFAGLADPGCRRQAAQSLATSLGAQDLILFTPDPELGVLLPAPEFPQTLPEGALWKAFLSVCVADGEATAGQLPYPERNLLREAQGVASPDGSVLVLLDGRPCAEDMAEIRLLLPLLGAAIRGERVAAAAQGKAAVALGAAAQARVLAETLDSVRRELEHALSEAQAARQRFAQFMQHLPGLAWIKDHEGRYVYVNEGVEKAFGLTAEQLYGKADQEFLPADIAAQFRENDRRAMASGTGVHGIETLVYHDGIVHHAVVTRFPIPGTERAAVMVGGIAIDITQRKRAEDALRKQNERLYLLSEAAADLLVAEDPKAMVDALFERVKDHVEADVYFNYALSESEHVLTLICSSGIPEDAMASFSRLELGQALCGTAALEHRSVTAAYIQASEDPKAQLIKSLGLRSYTCKPLLAGAQLLGTLAFGSRSKDAFSEEELELLQTLCHYVAAAYERIRLISRLRETDRRKDEFLATLAHELRNPLAPISNAVELIGLDKQDDSQLEELRLVMGRQVQQMVRLIDDLMDASRISRGKLTLRTECVALSSVVEAALESVRAPIKEAGQELLVQQTDEPLFLQADTTRLTQVLVNLLNNAAKYSPPGSRIWLTTERAENQAIVRVRDNGQGIPPDRLANIFEIFYQVDRSAHLGRSGLGIGLTLVKSLVEMHGGSIEAHSEGLGKGSEFLIRLPLATTRTAKHDGRSPRPSRPAGCQFRILVVEDEAVVARLFARMLSAMGHEVRIAPDGHAALEIVSTYNPDIIFSDISMPQMSGYDLARQLRTRRELDSAMLIAMTGYGQPNDRRRALDAGFDDHIVKPAQIDSLRNLFSRLARSRDPKNDL